MKWVVKAAVQRVASSVPRGRELNYLLQRRTGGLPFEDEKFLERVRAAGTHWRIWRERRPGSDPSVAAFYEFGAGWDLTVPLTYAALGLGEQTLVDIDPLLKVDLVNDSIAKLARLSGRAAEEAGGPLSPLGAHRIESPDELETGLGIRYLAPRDARATGLAGEGFDFVSSTNTMEHIPEGDIAPIYAECRRLLRPGGVLSCIIDTQDHYSYFDPGISRYNYLRFGERRWRLVNSPLHFQNRLRASDHVRLVEQGGFEVVSVLSELPDDWERERRKLEGLRLDARFRDRYELEDLGATGVRVVAIKS